MHTYEDFTHNSPGRLSYTWPGGGGSYEVSSVFYHRRLRKGERRMKPSVLNPTPYTLLDVQEKGPKGTGSVTAHGYPKGTEYQGTARFSCHNFRVSEKRMLDGWDGNLVDQASVKAMSKLSQRDFDLGTAWAERGKTAQLLGDMATVGVRALNAIRKRDGRRLLNELGLDHDGARGRGVVDAYLAYHYGMKPLMQDVAGATSALARLPPESWRIRVSAKAGKGESGTFPVHFQNGLAFSVRQSSFKGSRCIVVATQRQLTRHQDLMWATGLDNPLGTAWELTPFSFVVDWAIPIGDWLDGLNSLKYYKDFSVVRSQKYVSETAVGPCVTSTSGARYDCRFTGGGDRCVSLERRISSMPIHGLPVKNPVSVDHMAKALSLLASRSANAGELPRFIRY